MKITKNALSNLNSAHSEKLWAENEGPLTKDDPLAVFRQRFSVVEPFDP
jgi:hypothetical protein